MLRLRLRSTEGVLARVAGRAPKHSVLSHLGQRWAEQYVEVQGGVDGDPLSQGLATSSGWLLDWCDGASKGDLPGLRARALLDHSKLVCPLCPVGSSPLDPDARGLCLAGLARS